MKPLCVSIFSLTVATTAKPARRSSGKSSAPMNFRLPSGNITLDGCAAHFDHLATTHGIVHPRRALHQLQKAERSATNVSLFASALRQGLVLECEACVRWDGTKLHVTQRTPHLVHPDVLHRMEAVLFAASAPPFSTYVNTRDNAFCHVAGELADHVTGQLVRGLIQPHHVSRPTGCACGRLARGDTAPSE